MDSSRGFGSHPGHGCPCGQQRPVQTRLPCGCPPLAEVNQATRMHSPDHSTKGTPSALGGSLPQWPLAAGEYTGSGSLSSPCRGAFHLSLTVLLHYRSLKVISLGGWSPQLPTRFHVPRGTQDPSRSSGWARYRALTCSGRAFQRVGVHPAARCPGPTTPGVPKNAWFGLIPVRSPLLRDSRLISLRRATEMFQFAHCPPPCLWDSAGGVQTSLWTGCPIRNLRAHRSHAAPPERFAGLRVLLRPSAPRHPPRTLSRLCSPGSLLLFLLFAPSPLHLFRSRSRPTPPRHATHRDLSSRHAHSRFLCFSRSLSSCLGNIEVIMLFGL